MPPDTVNEDDVGRGVAAWTILDDAPLEERVAALRDAARIVARAEVADAVTEALNSYPGSLRDLQKQTGLDPAFVSRLARGEINKQGCTVASLAQIALALNKTLSITID